MTFRRRDCHAFFRSLNTYLLGHGNLVYFTVLNSLPPYKSRGFLWLLMLWWLVKCSRYNWTKGHCNIISSAVNYKASGFLEGMQLENSKRCCYDSCTSTPDNIFKRRFPLSYVFFTFWEQILFNWELSIWLSVLIILRFQNSHSLACFHKISWNYSLIK